MRFFRSERMTLCQMLLHKESAFDCLVELGYMGVVQFNNIMDINSVANSKFTNEIQRASELQRIMRHLQDEMNECGITPVFYPKVDEEEIPKSTDLKNIEGILHDVDKELTDVETNFEGLKRQKNKLREHWYVLTKTEEFLHGDRNTQAVMAWSDSIIINLIRDESRQEGADQNQRLGFVTGTIPVEKFHSFEVMLWRTCRGNCYVKHAEIPELLEDSQRFNVRVRKFVFIVVFVGEAVRGKVLKICQGFRTTLYECPESFDERVSQVEKLEQDSKDLDIVIERTDEHRRKILLIAAADLFIWRIKIKKILMVYTVLNKLGTVRQLQNPNYLQAECWIPTTEVNKVRRGLMRGARRAAKGDLHGIFPPILTKKSFKRKKQAPTYFRLNKFTRGFQNLIDSYGIAQYRELNPAPYTIVTFPFLFAVMFGDVGHGLIMMLFAMWMVRNEISLTRKLREATKPNEIGSILFAGRYIILLMGIFSIYTGLIYNDFFSKSLNLFGSHWYIDYTQSDVSSNKNLQLDPQNPSHFLGTPYVFGMDPVWDASGENAIIQMNSYKMKLAIVLGVTQMIFGLCLSAVNHKKNYVDLFLVTMPQLTFLLCLFFYLVFLIFFKWLVFGGHNEPPYNSACAPSILITFIDMILMKGSEKIPKGCEEHMFEIQPTLQKALLFVALITIPVLLAGKPLHIMRQARELKKMKDEDKRRRLHRTTVDKVRKSLIYNVEEFDEREEEIDIGEVWIHQGIHCIESVLGSVSHTASYLRLWALSLAHDQLSTVLWNMVLAIGLKGGNGYLNSFTLYFVFWCWSILTVAILVIMEGLSAFLHTLRLHWVEFQSKFYEGSGEAFMPFRFETSGPSTE